MRFRRVWSAFALALVISPPGAHAQARFFRVFAEGHGLRASAVWTLAQDEAGFIWLVSAGGLFRFDGVEMRRVVGHTPSIIFELAPLGAGVVARFEDGTVVWVGAGGPAPFPGPEGTPLDGVEAIARGGDGALWVIRANRVWRRLGDRWRAVASAWREDETPQRLQAAAGGVVAITNRGFWRFDEGSSTRLVDLERPLAAVERPGGGWWLLSTDAAIWEWHAGEPLERHRFEARAVTILRRGEWTWIGLDRALIAIDRDGVLVVRLDTPEVPSGGPLLLDHEQSLWMGTHGGALQFPDPETANFTEWPSARFLVLDGETLWVNTWLSAGSIRRRAAGWSSEVEPNARGRYCRDAHGRLWSSVRGAGIVRHDGGAGWNQVVEGGALAGCGDDSAGGAWLASGGSPSVLWRVDPGGSVPRRITEPLSSEDLALLLVDSRDRVWVRAGERVCWASGPLLAAAGAPGWSCTVLPGAMTITDLVELPSGAIWASSNRIGVWQVEPGGPRPLAGNDELASRQILGLARSADGSVWILGHGTIVRVREDPRAPAEWRVEEQVSPWQGALASGGQDLVETADGALWIATARGVMRVPRNAREARPTPPRVELVEARTAAGPLPLAGAPRLPFADRAVSLRFAALSYRDPALLRYQVRLSTEPWPEPSARANLEFPRLDPGAYRVEARASLDGVHWSDAASYAFRVAPPWYRTPWAIALWLAAAVAVLWAAHRARVGVLLALERQRTLVAMDLHDEMGSGLGAIGILSGLMARDAVEGEERRRLAREIAATSQDLGGALSDIVWALRSEGATLEALAARLAESGGRLFAAGQAAFSCRFPETWPSDVLPLQLRRNVLLAGLEALHNAARHASPSRVDLTLEPAGGPAWQLIVEDDGSGLPLEALGESRGLGLRSMRRRAEEIGGAIRWEPGPAGGTRVVLDFSLGRLGALP